MVGWSLTLPRLEEVGVSLMHGLAKLELGGRDKGSIAAVLPCPAWQWPCICLELSG